MKNKAEIIVALDENSLKEAEYFVDKLYPTVKIFKIGPQALLACGIELIWYINAKEAKVFLDLKFCDIPNTVANAVRMAVRLEGVEMLTLHISGGEEMLKNAVLAAKDEAAKLTNFYKKLKVDHKLKPPLLLGVTVLTSQEAKPGDVLKLARLGLKCGLDGVVCSAREAGILRKEIKKKFVIVTPGIRMASSDIHDQKRTATVNEAIRAGSNFLVVGRPILEARDPLAKAKEMLGDMHGAGN